jgi:CheY-like chemotaxis protein
MMPKLDGAGLLGAVAADPRLAKQHACILMTATNRTLGLAFAKMLSDLAVPVISKPFDLETVLDAVARAASRLVTA